MEKAFDRVSFSAINQAVASLGFGENFKRLISSHQAPRRRGFANGYYSEYFPLKSGVAQGCPLGPLIFVLIAEMLKISTVQEKGFKGITMHRYRSEKCEL